MRDEDLQVFLPPTAADTGRDRWLAIDPRSHASIRVVAETLANGADVRRLLRPHFDGGRVLQPGTWLIAGDHAIDAMSRASRETVRSWPVRAVERGVVGQGMPRIGLYVPWREDAIDSGWLRLWLEHGRLPYVVVNDDWLRAGDLTDLDVILFADQEPEIVIQGNPEADYPAPYNGGLGEDGVAALKAWIESGGTLVALDGAAKALAGPLHLPLRFPLAAAKQESFAAPGAIVRVEPDEAHPLMLGIDEPFPAMLQGNHAFAPRSHAHDATIAARFSPTLPLVSGWIRGWERLQGLGAIADTPLGRGRVVAFSFRPHFRTQMLASYAPLVNAIMRAGVQERNEDSQP